jgi:hypothetical protein
MTILILGSTKELSHLLHHQEVHKFEQKI